MQFQAGRPRLNFDVLRLVCNSLTDVSDVLSFTVVCSALTGDAFQRRLRMSPIDLSTYERVDSFHKFIFADQAARAPHVYGLKLPYLLLCDHVTYALRIQAINSRLVALLQATIKIEYIHFPATVNLHPVLTAAAGMTSLRKLHICFVEDSPWKLLGTFRSPLLSLHIEEGDDDDEGVTARSLHNHLANFAPTLEVLKLEFYSDVGITPSFVTTQFPAVRSLTIDTIVGFNQSTVEILLRLFPGLDGTLDLGRSLHTTHVEDVYTSWRKANQEVQKSVTWPCLNHVACNARCAFLMALQCPIRTMDLTVLRHDGQRYLAPVLRHKYPQRLRCTVSFLDVLDDSDELFPSTEGAANVTHLVMFVNFNTLDSGPGSADKRDEVPWSQFKNKLIASIRHLRLTHLRVVFYHDLLRNSEERDFADTPKEIDLLPAATEFACAMPTLQYVFLTTCGHKNVYFRCPASSNVTLGVEDKWSSSKAWQVAHDFSNSGSSVDAELEASCTELNRSTAEIIIAQEELNLSDYSEHALRGCGDFTR